MIEASARTYHCLKDNGSDPFDFENIAVQAQWIDNAPLRSNIILDELVGRLPGSWTLPVCDITGYDKEWNLDYNNKDAQPDPNLFYPGASDTSNLPHPPCFCGVYNLRGEPNGD